MSMRIVRGVYLADTARVLGEVGLGEGVSVWYSAVIRGDVARVTIGPGSNVQDNAVIHCDSGVPNTIGAQVTIGHGAIVHGVSVGDGSLIGMGAKLLGGTVVGRGCLVAAGALLPPNFVVPDGMVAMGAPARLLRPTSDKEKNFLAWLAPHYVRLAQLHASDPDHPRTRAFG